MRKRLLRGLFIYHSKVPHLSGNKCRLPKIILGLVKSEGFMYGIRRYEIFKLQSVIFLEKERKKIGRMF